MTTNFHHLISFQNEAEYCFISLSDFESLFLTLEEAQWLIQQLDEMLFLAPSGEEQHFEIADVPLTLEEVVRLR